MAARHHRRACGAVRLALSLLVLAVLRLGGEGVASRAVRTARVGRAAAATRMPLGTRSRVLASSWGAAPSATFPAPTDEPVPDELSDASRLRVLIAGAGIGGMLAANGLAKAGHEVHLFEKAPELRTTGGPILIQSNALASIEAINRTLAREAMRVGVINACRVNGVKDGLNGKWFCMFDTREPARRSGMPLTRVIKRQTLVDLFHAGVADNPRVHIHYNKQVTGYTQERLPSGANRVRATFGDGSAAEGDVLVGADGLWSAVRSVLHGQGPITPEKLEDRVRSAKYSGYACYEARCTYTPEEAAIVAYKVYIGRKKYFVLCDIGNGMQEWYAFIYTQVGTSEPQAQYGQTLRDAFAGWQQEVLDVLDATPDAEISRRDTFDRAPEVLRGWVDGSVTIMGDAAHPMMPNLGQGGCQAIEDAYRLAIELKEVQRRSDVPAALRSYQLRRLPRAAVVQGVARIASDMLVIYSRFANNALDWFSDVFVFCSSMGSIFAPRMFPFILGWLFAPDLDREDRHYITDRRRTPEYYEADAATELAEVIKAFGGRVPTFEELTSIVKNDEKRSLLLASTNGPAVAADVTADVTADQAAGGAHAGGEHAGAVPVVAAATPLPQPPGGGAAAPPAGTTGQRVPPS